ncbi:cellular tumor antigen p53-like isoform X2 [Macrosteles quadrilineatus]|uniref:cellular tumor antigen p53-like isoform X2 n=1 Tax=Macrosteles quadrilineatus TaxID=74068 RepID=UPI0023E1FEF6|nr:cellular tumor antigen p53-like isoform X2 [Macrosteles quadrilineatus]
MDHNYNDTPLLTNSDYESIMEDLKPDSFGGFGSPFRIDHQYGDVHLPVMQIQDGTNTPVTAVPQMSPSLSPTGTIPSREHYPGQFEFEVRLDSTSASKKSWLYSMLLSKVFIDMNKSLLIQFHVNDFRNGLYVRALPVYEQDDFVSVPVERCRLHSINDDPHGRAHPQSEPGVCYCHKNCMVRHVVLCTHPQARYDYNSESDRHSVVVPLQPPQPGSETTTIEYLFACKTSCPRGMNRKPIIVIYTLENEHCEVLGRLILPVKICSCPKRDKEKEEKEKEEMEKQGNERRGKRRISQEKPDKRVKFEIADKNGILQENNEDGIKRSDMEKINQRLENKITELENKIDKKFSEMENKITELENKIDKQFSEMENKVLSAINSMVKPCYM